MADDIAQWLDGLGLGQYARVFAENDLEFEVLPDLTDNELRELGLSLGHRKKLLRAIESFHEPSVPVTLAETVAKSDVQSQEAERRQLTVLFCDLVGSTALSTRLDPEDMRDVLRAYQDACSKVIARYGGYVAKFMGDGVYAYFGYPRAHEDDAERAINSALGIVEAVGVLQRDLEVRIGVSTGTVAVGDIVGEGASEEANVVGEAPNLAARLQELAEPNAIVISQETYALVGGLYETTDMGKRDLKGFAAPVRAWRVTGQGQAETRFEAAHAGRLTPLTGREEEVGLILRRWQLASGGEGQVVLLSGEAGIGKSRIVDTLCEHITDEPHFRLRYQCSPHHTNSVLYPIIDRLERAAGFAREDSSETKLEKLATLLNASGPPVPETISLFADFLSLPTGDRYPELGLDPRQRKERMLETLTDQVEVLAQIRPVLFIFEDAHWADPTSLELLDRVIDRVRAVRVTMVVTARPEFIAPWTGQAHTTFLTLSRLGRRDCEAMAGRVSEGRALPAELIRQIVERTDGVPLFVEELTKMVLESEIVHADGDGYALAGSLDSIEVPATLKDSLMARLDRLGPAREVAQVGSVIGREFGHELLASVVPLADDALAAALDRLVESGLAFRRGVGDEANYTFKHALVQDAAYDSLLRRRRTDLHARIARTLEEKFPETASSEPDLLAHHFTEGGQAEPAASYWLKAGQAAFRASAMAEAIAHVTRGLVIIEDLAQGPARKKLETALYAVLGLANKASRGLGYTDTEAAFARAYEVCRDDPDSPWLFPVLFSLCQTHWSQCQLDRAQIEAQELMRLAESSEDSAHMLVANFAVGSTHMHSGRLAAALHCYERVARLYDPSAHASLAFTHMLEFGVAHRFHVALIHLALGHPERAYKWAREAIAVAREQQPINLSAALIYGGFVPLFRGDLEIGLAWSEEAVALGRKHGFAQSMAFGRVNHGWALTRQGRGEEGVAEISEGISVARKVAYTALLPGNLALFADACIAAGRVEEALETVNEALDLVTEMGARFNACEVLWTRGDALLAQDPPREDEAEQSYRDAIDLARDQEAKSWELRAAIHLARLWRSQGKTSAARDLLTPIYGWFTEGFDTADLKEAKALLEELHVS